MIGAFYHFVFTRYRAIFLAGLISGMFLVSFLPRLKMEHSLDGWMDKHGDLYKKYRNFTDTFGGDETILAAFRVSSLFQGDHLQRYLRAVDRIRETQGVRSVVDPVGPFMKKFGFDRNWNPEKAGWSEFDPGMLRILRSGRNDLNVVSSPDGSMAGLLIYLDRSKQEEYGDILRSVREQLDSLSFPYHIAGTAYFSETLSSDLSRDLFRLVPVLVGIACLILYFYFRSVLLVASVFFGILLGLVYTFSFILVLGIKINLLTLILFPLVFSVGITTAIHLFVQCGRAGREEGSAGIEKAFRGVFSPAFVASFTTALGAFSFAFSQQEALRVMGWIIPVGVLITHFSVFSVVPATFRVFSGNWNFPSPRISPNFYVFSIPPRARRIFIYFVGLSSTAFLMFIPYVKINPDAIFFFKNDSELIRSYKFIEKNLAGLLPVELIVRSEDKKPLDDGEHFHDVQTYLRQVRKIQEFSGSQSIYDLPEPPGPGDPAGKANPEFITAAKNESRISLRFRNLTDKPFPELNRELREAWNLRRHDGLTMWATGIVPMILLSQSELLRTQAVTFLFIFGVISLFLYGAFRSFRVSFFSVSANFFPLAVTLGTMPVLGISINCINIFVASVILGVIVDDTVHLLYGYRRYGSIERALGEIGPALWLTSLTVIFCFSALLGSSILPVYQFGLLSSIAVLIGYYWDVYLLPLLIKRTQGA